jgi:hypothetical protein
VGRLLPWFAVAYGAGIVLYFTAKREPAIEVDTIKSYSVAAANYLFKLLGNESLKTKAISMSRRLYEEAGAYFGLLIACPPLPAACIGEEQPACFVVTNGVGPRLNRLRRSRRISWLFLPTKRTVRHHRLRPKSGTGG